MTDRKRLRDAEHKTGTATEAIAQAKDSTRYWFIVWIITMAMLFSTNIYWIHVFQSYDYVSQNGSGVNNYNSWNGGDTNNGTEDQKQEK